MSLRPNERLIDGQLSWYLSPRGYPVRLDACSSRGERFRWRVSSSGGVTVLTTDWRALGKRGCARTVFLPEADYVLTLDVRSGSQRDSTSVPASVQNILIVAMGDSYASGEGNPRNVRSWLRRGGAFVPYWDDDPCHRSTRAGPAQAALALEKASRTTSVTLVFVACSGATVDRGVLGPQVAAGQSESQIEQATRLLGGREADLVLLSGGRQRRRVHVCPRDVRPQRRLPHRAGFLGPPLRLPDPPDRHPGADGRTAGRLRPGVCLHRRIGLPAGRRTNRGRPPTGAAGHVLPVLYPDITRAADGAPCSYLTIGQKDFAWARDTVLVPAPVNPYPYPLSPRRNGQPLDDGGVAEPADREHVEDRSLESGHRGVVRVG